MDEFLEIGLRLITKDFDEKVKDIKKDLDEKLRDRKVKVTLDVDTSTVRTQIENALKGINIPINIDQHTLDSIGEKLSKVIGESSKKSGGNGVELVNDETKHKLESDLRYLQRLYKEYNEIQDKARESRTAEERSRVNAFDKRFQSFVADYKKVFGRDVNRIDLPTLTLTQNNPVAQTAKEIQKVSFDIEPAIKKIEELFNNLATSITNSIAKVTEVLNMAVPGVSNAMSKIIEEVSKINATKAEEKSMAAQMAKAEEEGNKKLQTVYTVSEEIMKAHIESMRQLTTMMASQVTELEKHNKFNGVFEAFVAASAAKQSAEKESKQKVAKPDHVSEISETLKSEEEKLKLFKDTLAQKKKEYKEAAVDYEKKKEEALRTVSEMKSYTASLRVKGKMNSAELLIAEQKQSFAEEWLSENVDRHGIGRRYYVKSQADALNEAKRQYQEQESLVKKLQEELALRKQITEEQLKVNQKTINTSLGKIDTQIANMQTMGAQQGLDFAPAIEKLREFRKEFENVSAANTQMVKDMVAKMPTVVGEAKRVRDQIRENNKLTPEQRQEQETRRREKEALDYINALKKVEEEILRLSKLEAQMKSGSFTGDKDKIEYYARKVRELINELQRLQMAGGTSAGLSSSVANVSARAGLLVSQFRNATFDPNEAANASMKAGDAQSYLTKNVDKANSLLRAQANIARDLSTIFTNAFSIYGLQGFLRSLVEVGGEFEKQKIALQSILGDFSKAQSMFNRIKDLAVESPFTFRQLSADAKQLAAFQIPYNELYDTTKRLADISAGVGVDVNRLILAYGQVRSAAFLRGQELRQFTEAGVPMVDALARKLSEVNNRAVSASEVFEMISKKQVPFEYVKEVLFEMTDEGGKFYNMQENLADSIAGKWSNLGDAYDVMLSQMAESNSTLIKTTIDTLKSFMSNWETIRNVAIGAVAGLGFKKLLGAGGASWYTNDNFSKVQREVLYNKQKEANLLRLQRAYRTLTEDENTLINTSNRLTAAELKHLVVSKQLTVEQVRYAVATGRLNKELAQEAIGEKVLGNVQKFKLWGRVTNGLAYAFRNATLAIKSMLVSFAPMLLFSAIIEGIGHLIQKNRELNEHVENTRKLFGDTFSNANEELSKFKFGDIESLDSKALIDGVKEMKQWLLDNDPMASGFLKELYEKNGDDMVATYKGMMQRIKDIREWSQDSSYATMGADALEATDNLGIDDNLLENIRDYENELTKMQKSTAAFVRNNPHLIQRIRTQFEEIITSSRNGVKTFSKEWSENFAKEFGNVSDFSKIATEDMMRFAVAQRGMMSRLKNRADLPIGNFTDYTRATSNAMDDAYSFIESIASNVSIEDTVNKTGLKFDKAAEKMTGELTERGKFRVRMVVDEALGELRNSDIGRRVYEILKISEQDIDGLYDKFMSPVRKAITENLITDGRKNTLNVWLGDTTDYIGIIDTLTKKKKEIDDAIKKLEEPLTYWLKIYPQITIEDIKNSTKDELAKKMKGITDVAKSVFQEANNLYNDKDIITSSGDFLHTSFEEKKEKKTGTKKDAVADAWNRRVDAIQKAVDAFNKWKKVEGSVLAQERVMSDEEWGTVLKDLEKNFGIKLNLEAPKGALEEAYKKLLGGNTLEQLRKKYEQRYSLALKIRKEIGDEELRDIQDAVKRRFDMARESWTELSNQWSLFQDVFNATGNKGLALSISGIDQLYAVEDKMQLLLDDFSKATGRDFYDVQGMSPEDFSKLDDNVKSYYENRKKDIENLKNENKKAVADIFKRWKTMEDEISIIERKRVHDLGNIERDNSLTPEQKAVAQMKIDQDAAFDIFKQRNDYFDFYNSQMSMTYEEAVKFVDQLRTHLDNALKNGSINVDNYIKELEKVDDILHKIENTSKGLDDAQWFTASVDEKLRYQENKYLQGLNSARHSGNKDAEQHYIDLIVQVRELQKQMKRLNRAMDVFNAFDESVGYAANALEKLGLISNSTAENLKSSVKNAVSGANTGNKIGTKMGSMLGMNSAVTGSIGMVFGMWFNTVSDILKKHREDTKKIHEAFVKKLDRYSESVTTRLNEVLGGFYTYNYANDEFIRRLRQTVGYNQQYNVKEQFNGRDNSGDSTGRVGRNGRDETVTYDLLLEALNTRKDVLQTKLMDERKKIHSDALAIEEFESQISDIETKIDNFTKDIAKSFYDIDFKGFAGQLTDALVNSWKAGTDAAEEYGNTVSTILEDVAKRVIDQSVMQVLLQPLEDKLIAQLDKDKGELTDDSLNIIADIINMSGEAAEKSAAIMDKVEQMANDRGISLRDSTSGSLGGSITNITEDTADLLASYLNAIRMDVSIIRTLQESALSDGEGSIMNIANAQLASLRSIQGNVEAIRESNAGIYEAVTSLENNFNSVMNGTKQVHIA